MPVVYSTFVEDQTHNDTYLLITLGGTQLEIGSDPTFDGKTVNLPSDLRLCRLTDDAPGDMPRYSHRNGETEPPTTKGNYWVKGFATINGAIMRLSLMLTVADWRDSAMYAKLPDGGLVTVRGTSTGFASAEWNCEWWGPVMPPWEANNE